MRLDVNGSSFPIRSLGGRLLVYGVSWSRVEHPLVGASRIVVLRAGRIEIKTNRGRRDGSAILLTNRAESDESCWRGRLLSASDG